MNAIQKVRGYSSSYGANSNNENNGTASQVTTPTPRVVPKACFKCGSRYHKACQCPLTHPPSETPRRSQQATNAIWMIAKVETLDARHAKLREELTTAEFDQPKQLYTDQSKVDLVFGCVGPLYYAMIVVEEIPIRAMVDPGFSSTIISFEKFKETGMQMGIQPDSLKRPNLTLYDYSQKLIPVGATVELIIKWKEQEVTTQVYIQAQGNKGEPCLLGTNVVILLELMKPDPNLEEQEVG